MELIGRWLFSLHAWDDFFILNLTTKHFSISTLETRSQMVPLNGQKMNMTIKFKRSDKIWSFRCFYGKFLECHVHLVTRGSFFLLLSLLNFNKTFSTKKLKVLKVQWILNFSLLLLLLILYNWKQLQFTDRVRREKDKYKFMCTDMEATFLEMAGF